MDFEKLSAARYSLRKFSQAPIEPEKLALVLEAGRNAPTAHNNQPQRIILVSQKENLARLSEITSFVFGAPVCMIICADKQSAWVNTFDNRSSAETDAAIVTTQMMLQAHALGLGTCWVCYFDRDAVRKAFNIPDAWEIECLLPMGYPADDARPGPRHTQRLPLQKTVFEESL